MARSAEEKVEQKRLRKRLRQDEAAGRSAASRAKLAGVIGDLAGRTLGAERLLLIDVGARGRLPGEWQQAIPWLRVIGFDTDQRAAADYTHLDYPMEFVPRAVAGTAGARLFYRLDSLFASSLLKPDRAVIERYRGLETLRLLRVLGLKTVTLDDLVRERRLAFVDAIKLDTQGSELEILKGGRETLARLAFCVKTEVEFVPLYEQQPLFTDLDPFVRSHGFELMALESQRRFHRRVARFDELGLESSNGQLVTADALYFRSPEAVATLLERLDESARVRYLTGAVVVCLIYRQPDYAVHLIEVTAPLLRTEVADDLYGCIARYQSRT